jgi:RNA polymerase sigma-70 factor (ECF subfamily)
MSARDDPGPQGFRGAFPSTRWSRILRGRGSAERADWEALARAYERPIREWLRCRLGDADAAEDLAQEFFAWMMESGLVARADPARGRFRAFLKTALQHFVVDRERAARTEKRGGGRARISLDDESGAPAVAARAEAPDEALDAGWRAALLERALRALEEDLASHGKELYFRVFREYFLAGDEELAHADLAARHDLRVTDVSNYLRVAKNRFREYLRREVLATVGGPEEFGAELAWVFAAVAKPGGAGP